MLEEKTTQEIEAFCKSRGIKIINGKISERDIGEVRNYLKKVADREREYTRFMERDTNCTMKFLVKSWCNELNRKIVFSPIEDYLWEALIREELVCGAERLYKLGPYEIDIAYPEIRLAVECDGKAYHRENQEQLERDQKRDKYLARKGWRTLRITGTEIRRSISSCVDRVKFFIDNSDLKQKMGAK